MSYHAGGRLAGLLMLALIGSQRGAPTTAPPADDGQPSARAGSFLGSKGGDGREVHGVKLRWCPPGKFTMGKFIGKNDQA